MCLKTVSKGIAGVLIEGGKLSIGRLMMLSIFILCSIRWMQGVDIPSTMLTFLMSLLAYVMGSKIVGNVSDTIKNLKGVTNTVTTVFNNVTGKDKDIELKDVDPEYKDIELKEVDPEYKDRFENGGSSKTPDIED